MVPSNLACAQDLMWISVEWKVASLRQYLPINRWRAPYVVASAKRWGVLLAIVYVNQHGFIRKPRSSKKRYLEGTALNKKEGGRGSTPA
jgi:hypothetical protein